MSDTKLNRFLHGITLCAILVICWQLYSLHSIGTAIKSRVERNYEAIQGGSATNDARWAVIQMHMTEIEIRMLAIEKGLKAR